VQLARIFSLKGDLARSEQQAGAAVALLQLPRMTGLADVRVGHLATALHQLGYAQARRAENGPALASLEQSVVFARQQADAHPGDLVVVGRLARIQIDAAQQKVVAGRTADALSMFRDAQHGLEQLLDRDPRNARYRGYLVELLNDEGDAFIAAQDEASARGAFTRAVTMAEALLADGPDDQGNQIAAMMSHYSLGAALIRFGDTEDGIRRFRQAIAEAEAIGRTSPDSGFVIDQLASVRAELGEALIGRHANDAEGCRQVGDALTLWNRVAASSATPRESSQFRGKYERMWTRCHASAAK
jgi:tetratricopeptide (TPR) repeat protein